MRLFHVVLLSSLSFLVVTLSVPARARADESTAFVMTNTHTYERELGLGLTLGRHTDAMLVGLQAGLRWPIGDFWSVGAHMPIVSAHARDVADDMSLGNLTLSGTVLLAARPDRRATRVSALHLSISAPTAGASDNGIDAGRRFAAFYLPDPGLYRPNTTTLRVHWTLRSQRENYFGQLEVGMHQLIIDDADDQTRLRLGLALGVKVSRSVVLLGELTNMSDIIDDTNSEDFWHVLDLGMRVRISSGQLAMRVYLPLDRSSRDADMVGVMFGYEQLL